jgi:nucleotide-binding universal stress UspA family protein
MENKALRKIVVAIDFVDEAADILQIAGELGNGLAAEIQLIHVFDPEPVQIYNTVLYPVLMPGETSAEHEAVLQMERIQLRSQADRLRQLGVKTFAFMKPVEGTISKSILEFAEGCGADLILLGTSRPSRFEEMLIGSVAKKVLRKSRIPVLLVPRKSPER